MTDDTYCIFENINQVESFLECLNSQHSNIKFTHEVEENNSLAFLDILVIHSGNGFATNLYRKKTFTGLYNNFESLSPSKYKVNLATVLVYRAFHICSSYVHFHDQLCNIKRFLQQNCFPKHLIDKLIKKFLDGRFIPKIRPATVSKLPVIFCLPYLGQYSLRVKKKLCKFLGSTYPHVDFQVVFQSAKHIENFFPFKDRVPAHICSSVVYKFTCSSCQATYYGKTSRHFIVRCREH